MSPRKRFKGRSLHGILLFDKPLGLSSNAALQQVKRLYFAEKAGHTGSLDPLASGMLPICFGEATKLAQFLLEADKCYEVTAKLGIKTTTADAEGDIISTRPVNVTLPSLQKILKKFQGDITQIPSMYSAIKHQGTPLYTLARRGLEIERTARSVTIHELTLTHFEGDTLQLFVRCSKGTYVRNLIEDIGEELGCGAHVSALRRTQIANFETSQMVSLEQLETLKQAEKFAEMDALLLPLSTMVKHLPKATLSPIACFQWQQGNPVQMSGLPSQGDLRVYNQAGELIGMGQINEEGLLAPKRLLSK